jgi:PIN domain nuclease of toxin-antitoxin system
MLVSSISVWEVAMLVARGRLELTLDVADWVAKSEALPFLGFVPVSNAIAIRSVRLPGDFHEDPADRIIVATAMTMGARVVSKDTKIRSYPYVEVLW